MSNPVTMSDTKQRLLSFAICALLAGGCGHIDALKLRDASELRDDPAIHARILKATRAQELPQSATKISFCNGAGVADTDYLIFTADHGEMEAFVSKYAGMPLSQLSTSPSKHLLIMFSDKNKSLNKRFLSQLTPASRIQKGRYIHEDAYYMAVDVENCIVYLSK